MQWWFKWKKIIKRLNLFQSNFKKKNSEFWVTALLVLRIFLTFWRPLWRKCEMVPGEKRVDYLHRSSLCNLVAHDLSGPAIAGNNLCVSFTASALNWRWVTSTSRPPPRWGSLTVPAWLKWSCAWRVKESRTGTLCPNPTPASCSRCSHTASGSRWGRFQVPVPGSESLCALDRERSVHYWSVSSPVDIFIHVSRVIQGFVFHHLQSTRFDYYHTKKIEDVINAKELEQFSKSRHLDESD